MRFSERIDTFIACYLEDDFFNAEFTNDTLVRINQQLETLDQLTVERGRSVDTRDINTRKSRLLLLRNNLDAIVERLQNSLQLDIRGGKLEDNFSVLVKQIKATLKSEDNGAVTNHSTGFCDAAVLHSEEACGSFHVK